MTKSSKNISTTKPKTPNTRISSKDNNRNAIKTRKEAIRNKKDTIVELVIKNKILTMVKKEIKHREKTMKQKFVAISIFKRNVHEFMKYYLETVKSIEDYFVPNHLHQYKAEFDNKDSILNATLIINDKTPKHHDK